MTKWQRPGNLKSANDPYMMSNGIFKEEEEKKKKSICSSLHLWNSVLPLESPG